MPVVSMHCYQACNVLMKDVHVLCPIPPPASCMLCIALLLLTNCALGVLLQIQGELCPSCSQELARCHLEWPWSCTQLSSHQQAVLLTLEDLQMSSRTCMSFTTFSAAQDR